MKCPTCGRDVKPQGKGTMPNGTPADLYQCDTCVGKWEFDGAVFDVAKTFAVVGGEFFDPATGDAVPVN